MGGSYEKIIDLCKETECEYSTESLLKEHTSFKIGGKADLTVFPNSTEKIAKLVCAAKENNIPLLVIGKGSNLLVSDNGFRGLVICTGKFEKIELIDDTTIRCTSGTPLLKLCRFALENSLSGLEFAYGIPGSAGGAAYMNAGAYGGEMKNVLISCEHIDENGNISSLSGEELRLGYRCSAYTDSGFIITSLTLKLNKGDKNEIEAEMNELMKKRKEKQPLDFPSAGSTFKRPEGYFAGALIEQCGLKGCRVGGAMVSEKHAGFIVNAKDASSEDVIRLIAHCRKVVFEKTGVMLEPEVKIIN